MKMTHNEARRVFQNGEIDRAWEIARQDEGLRADVTKEQWVAFMERLTR